MRNLSRRFLSDQRGNFAVMSVGGMMLAICCASLGVDVGTISADRRKTQSATDIAAIVAASNLGNATAAATAAVTKNNYPADAVTKVELGTYTPDKTVASQNRFVTPAVGTANAVRVSLQTSTPLYFAKFFTGTDAFKIVTSATAATTQAASFAIGSRLASVNNGILNSILGSMLGTTLSLSVLDYNNLLNARIDAFDFLGALATRVGQTAATYANLLSGNIKVADILAAALSTQQAASGNNAATMALSSVVSATSGSSTKMNVGSLIGVGPYSTLTAGTNPKLGVALSVFDLLNAVAGISNGTNQINTNLTLGIPGIASVGLMVTVGEHAQGSSWVQVGTQGASLHTAQTRILLSVQLLGAGILSAVGVTLPLYVEVGAGTATLSSIACGYPDISSTSVHLGVTPGVIDAWIAKVTTADMTNFNTKPNPPPATLVNLILTSLTGRAHVAIGNTTPTDVAFSYSDITGQVKKTVSTSNYTSSLIGSLLGDLDFNLLGLPLPSLGGLVTAIITPLTAPLDSLLLSVLSALGVGIGQADVWVSGVRCDGAVLVN
jgi:uncharacterized membrane protein